MIYALLFLSGLSGAIGDIGLYKWAKNDSVGWLVVAVVSWSLSLGAFGLLLRIEQRSLTVLFVLSAAVHILTVVACDRISVTSSLSRTEWLGVLLGIAAILVIQLGQQPDEAHERHILPTLAQHQSRSVGPGNEWLGR